MTGLTRISVVVLAILLAATFAVAQPAAAPAGENTITVSAPGMADSDPDWAEVNVSLSGQAASVQEAIAALQGVYGAALDALQKVGVAKEDVRVATPRISAAMAFGMGGMGGPMGPPGGGGGGGGAPKFNVNCMMTARIPKVNPATMYDDLAKIADAAISVKGVSLPGGGGGMMMMMMPGAGGGGGDALVFGVKDPKALRDKAISTALDTAKDLADIAATKSGKKLGPLVAVSVADGGGMGPVRNVSGGPQTTGQATYTVTLSATYKTQ